MIVRIYESGAELAAAAAEAGAEKLRQAIAERGRAVFLVATGGSQIEFIRRLTEIPGIEWERTVMFHLDNYVGLPSSHPGCFHRYLKERLIDRVNPGAAHLIDGLAADPQAECERYGRLLEPETVDVCFAGIGESGHLAFNDPPADFKTRKSFFVTPVSEVSRRQLAGEGWFESPEECPATGITISIERIMKSRSIVSVVPEARKAEAVHNCLENGISPDYPASILRLHPDCQLFLDSCSAARLKGFRAALQLHWPAVFSMTD